MPDSPFSGGRTDAGAPSTVGGSSSKCSSHSDADGAGIDCKSQRSCQMWELVAASNHGPEIPCMAAVILANRLHRGEAFVPGARVCMGILELSEFAPEFARWAISTRISECTS